MAWVDIDATWSACRPKGPKFAALPADFTTPAVAWTYGAYSSDILIDEERPVILKITLQVKRGRVGVCLTEPGGGPMLVKDQMVGPGKLPVDLYFEAPRGVPFEIVLRNFDDDKEGKVSILSLVAAAKEDLPDVDLWKLGLFVRTKIAALARGRRFAELDLLGPTASLLPFAIEGGAASAVALASAYSGGDADPSRQLVDVWLHDPHLIRKLGFVDLMVFRGLHTEVEPLRVLKSLASVGAPQARLLLSCAVVRPRPGGALGDLEAGYNLYAGRISAGQAQALESNLEDVGVTLSQFKRHPEGLPLGQRNPGDWLWFLSRGGVERLLQQGGWRLVNEHFEPRGPGRIFDCELVT